MAAMLLEARAYWWQPEAHGSMWMVAAQAIRFHGEARSLKHFLSSFVIGRTSIRSEQTLTRSGKF
jgi:hypothetical protein